MIQAFGSRNGEAFQQVYTASVGGDSGDCNQDHAQLHESYCQNATIQTVSTVYLVKIYGHSLDRIERSSGAIASLVRAIALTIFSVEEVLL